MSVYSSVDIPAGVFDEGPDASPWVDVAHDNGGWDVPEGCVRVSIGRDFGHYAMVYLTRPQATALASMLMTAADSATPDGDPY